MVQGGVVCKQREERGERTMTRVASKTGGTVNSFLSLSACVMITIKWPTRPTMPLSATTQPARPARKA